MKLALDVWYELWEKTAIEDGSSPYQRPDEEDPYHPWREDYRAWIGNKETLSDSR